MVEFYFVNVFFCFVLYCGITTTALTDWDKNEKENANIRILFAFEIELYLTVKCLENHFVFQLATL